MKKRVLIFGSFDIIHPGHAYLIKEAQKDGQVFVCLARDETIKKVKGQLPHFSEQERAQHLEEKGLTVVLGSLGDKYEVFRQVKPEVVVLGYDQQVFVEGLEKVIKEEGYQTEIKRCQPLQPQFFKSSKLRSIIEDQDSGFLLINKPIGQPSFKTVVVLRKHTGQKKIGFAGTLDPLASGLLVVGLNRATRLLDAWHLFPKEYLGEITLGAVTDTFDAEGAILAVSNREVTKQEIDRAVQKFIGRIEQQPPSFSAKKIAGRKAYELARAGKEVCLRKQQIEIYELRIMDYQYPVLKIKVLCSSGTYIRCLANDIGHELGVGGYLSALQRTAIGPFRVEQAKTVEEIIDWRKELISVNTLLDGLKK